MDFRLWKEKINVLGHSVSIDFYCSKRYAVDVDCLDIYKEFMFKRNAVRYAVKLLSERKVKRSVCVNDLCLEKHQNPIFNAYVGNL
ncbi:MAG: hypothetical protein J6V90_08085 [Treponema sp.]|nr:hypothetical protein [Treponema sp.]